MDQNYKNILLLGETGTGKSTFINSFFNYLKFPSLKIAINHPELTCIIPAKFSITTKDGDIQEVHFKKDDNENNQLGKSSTQRTKSYEFPFGTKNIRIIDTPGINNTQGATNKDRDNFQNIFDYIGQLSNLHAICFLLKPDVTAITADFRYCLAELLSRLNPCAANNIIFLFTRTRSTGYCAPETINCLKMVLDEIAEKEGVTIPLRYKTTDHRNCFFFDNEGFNYLIAKQQGLQMLNPEQYEKSWEVSYNSTWDLIKYIVGDEKHPELPPHDAHKLLFTPLNIEELLPYMEYRQGQMEQIPDANIISENALEILPTGKNKDQLNKKAGKNKIKLLDAEGTEQYVDLNDILQCIGNRYKNVIVIFENGTEESAPNKDLTHEYIIIGGRCIKESQGINENNYGQVASGYCNPSIEKAGKTVFRLSQELKTGAFSASSSTEPCICSNPRNSRLVYRIGQGVKDGSDVGKHVGRNIFRAGGGAIGAATGAILGGLLGAIDSFL